MHTGIATGRAILCNRYFISRVRNTVLVWRLTMNGIICGVVLRYEGRHFSNYKVLYRTFCQANNQPKL